MRNKISNLMWGLVFIVLGVGIAGKVLFQWDFQIFFRGWWTLFIIIPCLASLIRNGITGGAVGGLIVGVMLLVAQYVDINVSVWKLIIPVVLIVIGLKIMFQGAFRKTIRVDETVHVDGQESFTRSNKSDYSAVFASNRIKVTDRFVGTNLNSVFGGITLDLRDAIIDCDVEIGATAVFGGIDIYVPSGVSVKINNIPIFGGVSNKAAQTTGQNAYTIYLNSTTMFGGIDIK